MLRFRLTGKFNTQFTELQDIHLSIVSQLRLTAGVEVAMFIYEVETQSFKVSLRSNGNVDVSKIAVYFGGGGHMRAAGCDLQGSVYDVINNVTEQICKQFQEQEV